ncbi:hypothetical protein OROGR_025489 [Orobanche gracilis]
MQAIVMALEGKALIWYHWWERCNPAPGWECFKLAVVRRFQRSMVQNLSERLLSLKQTGTVEEFVEGFEKYVGALRTTDQEFVQGIFLNGLKEEVQAEGKQLRVIILHMDEEEGVEDQDQANEEQTLNFLQLSLYSMSGFTTAKSWKVEGSLQGVSIVILLDCGASNNFIAHELVQKMNLEVQDTSCYVVEVRDGHKVKTRGKCADLQLQLQQLDINQDFYLFTLSGVDMVLELERLASLREVRANFGKLELTVQQGNKSITISGNPALTRTSLSFGALMQVLKQEGKGL